VVKAPTDVRFIYQHQVNGVKEGLINVTWRFLNDAEYAHSMDVYYNDLLLLHDDGKRVMIDEKASWYMDDMLLLHLTADGASVLQLLPEKLPLLHRVNEKTERIVYQVKFKDHNRTEEFVTKVIHTCETIQIRGKNKIPTS